jgi:hypothetical protein
MTVEERKAELKRPSTKAVQAKMDLHDLSEELPVDWQRIPDVARRAHEAFALLAERRAELAALEGAT